MSTTVAAPFLSKRRIIAGPDFNRWLVPPAALAVHLCIGMAYGFSVFWKPLQSALIGADDKPLASCAAGAATFADKWAGTARALTATDCNWTQFDLGWMYTLFFLVLGVSAALFGTWLERVGPRRAGLTAMVCWCGGLVLGGIGVQHHWLWLMWLGSGLLGGIGLGIGYISPVSTLMKWFPDRRGMAAGLAIAGFGGGAMIGSPLATMLMAHYASHGDPGVAATFYTLAAIYAVFMTWGSLTYRLPPKDWEPLGYEPPAEEGDRITHRHVHVAEAHRTPQFWLLWLVLCMNVSAGIGIIGAASPMLQETFAGSLVGHGEVAFEALKQNPDLMKKVASVAAGFVGLLSLFNIGGRFFWASASDHFGRRNTYLVFFVLGIAMYLLAAHAAGTKSLGVFVASFCVIASMYGGGFATIPAFLADLFGTHYVGAIHGRLLTAWSTAGVVGPVIVNYLHDLREESGAVSHDMIYGSIFWVLAALLAVGLVAALALRPVADKHFMDPKIVEEEQRATHDQHVHAHAADASHGSAVALAVAWSAVGIPVLYGIWVTLQKAVVLFQ
jgi:MFS family permease